MVADGQASRVRLDGVAAQVFTADSQYGSKGYNGHLPKEGDLNSIKKFLNGPVNDAVLHFKKKFLENQENLISSINPELSGLRSNIQNQRIAEKANIKLEEHQEVMLKTAAQYEKHLQ